MAMTMSEEIKRIISSYDTRPHFDRIKQLIQQEGVNVDRARGYDNATLLTTAAFCGDLDCVKFLIQKGANIQHRDSLQQTPLHYAACEGHLDVVKYLIQNGAAIDAVSKKNKTPLWWASFYGHFDVVKYLLDMGADHSIPDEDGRTPLQVAEEENETQVVDLLRQHTQEKVEIGKQRRLQLVQQQQQGQQKQKEEAQEEEQDEGIDDSLCLDGTVIQSSNELKLIISFVEKKLKLFLYSHENLDKKNLNQCLAEKQQLDALMQINKDGKLVSLLQDSSLNQQIDHIKREMNQQSLDSCKEEWFSRMSLHDVEDNPKLEKVGLDYLECNAKMEEKISSLYSKSIAATHAFEHRRIAMGQL